MPENPETKFPDDLPKIGQKIIMRAKVFGADDCEKEAVVTDIVKDRPKKENADKDVFLVYVDGKNSPSLVFTDGAWTLILEIPCSIEIVAEIHHHLQTKKAL